MNDLDNMKKYIVGLINDLKRNTCHLLKFDSIDEEEKNAIFLHFLMIVHFKAINDIIQAKEFKIFLNNYMVKKESSKTLNVEDLIRRVLFHHSSFEKEHDRRRRDFLFVGTLVIISFAIEGLLLVILDCCKIDTDITGIPGIIIASAVACSSFIAILALLLENFNSKYYQYVTGGSLNLSNKLRPFVHGTLLLDNFRDPNAKELLGYCNITAEDTSILDDSNKVEIFNNILRDTKHPEFNPYDYSDVKSRFFALKDEYRNINTGQFDENMTLDLT